VKRVAAVLLVSWWIAAPLAGRADPIQTDRPGQTDPAYVLPKGTAQIELGAAFARENDDGHMSTWDAPEPELRIGVFERAELRISALGWIGSREDGDGTKNQGSDLELSTKLRLLEQQEWWPATSLLAGVSLPTGGSAVSSDGVDPFGKVIASLQLGERFSLDANLGLAAPTQGVSDSRRVYELFAATSLGFALSERTGTFLEYAATVRGRGEPDEHALDGGFTYLVTDDVQLDVSAGAGLNHAAPDYVIGVGLAWRFWRPAPPETARLGSAGRAVWLPGAVARQ